MHFSILLSTIFVTNYNVDFSTVVENNFNFPHDILIINTTILIKYVEFHRGGSCKESILHDEG